MARRPKKDGAETAPEESQSSNTTLILPPGSVIKKLAKEQRSASSRAAEIRGEYGNSVAKAVEDKHVDRKALSIALQLDKLPDERLHVVWMHLMHYTEQLGVQKRALAQEEMFAGGAEGGDKDEEDDAASNVTHLGAAARKVAERAGAETA